MANKKAKIADEVIETENNTVVNKADETEALKAKIAEQEKQMAEMMAQMKLMMQAQMSVNNQPVKSNKSIKFISLVTGGLSLKGNRMYHIDKQFGYKMIPEGEAKAIVANMPNTITNGMVYIADKDFITECELDGVYEEILSDKQLKELLSRSADDVVEIYKSASPMQKQIIIDMVSNRRMNGMPVDANIVVEISKLCGKNLMEIEPEEDETK